MYVPPKERNLGGRREKRLWNVQLQQCQVGIAVIGPVFALLRNIVLEDGCCLGIVAIEAIENSVDVLGSVGCVVECYAHGCLEAEDFMGWLWFWRF